MLIMLGSGTLPVTLMHLHERTSIPVLVGVDTDPMAIQSIQRLQNVLGWTRLKAQEANALDHIKCCYHKADVVYIANLIHPKVKALEIIGEQVRPGTCVIVREGVGIGEIFAESVTSQQLPSGFHLKGAGAGHSGRFHSRHVFLVKEEWEGDQRQLDILKKARLLVS